MNPDKIKRLAHFLSLCACILVIFLFSFSYIKDNKAYIDIFGNKELNIGKCYFKERLGRDCPTCGMSRSFISFYHGDIKTSFAYNVFGPILAIALFGVILVNLATIFRLRLADRFMEIMLMVIAVLAILIVVYWFISQFIWNPRLDTTLG